MRGITAFKWWLAVFVLLPVLVWLTGRFMRRYYLSAQVVRISFGSPSSTEARAVEGLIPLGADALWREGASGPGWVALRGGRSPLADASCFRFSAEALRRMRKSYFPPELWSPVLRTGVIVRGGRAPALRMPVEKGDYLLSVYFGASNPGARRRCSLVSVEASQGARKWRSSLQSLLPGRQRPPDVLFLLLDGVDEGTLTVRFSSGDELFRLCGLELVPLSGIDEMKAAYRRVFGGVELPPSGFVELLESVRAPDLAARFSMLDKRIRYALAMSGESPPEWLLECASALYFWAWRKGGALRGGPWYDRAGRMLRWLSATHPRNRILHELELVMDGSAGTGVRPPSGADVTERWRDVLLRLRNALANVCGWWSTRIASGEVPCSSVEMVGAVRWLGLPVLAWGDEDAVAMLESLVGRVVEDEQMEDCLLPLELVPVNGWLARFYEGLMILLLREHGRPRWLRVLNASRGLDRLIDGKDGSLTSRCVSRSAVSLDPRFRGDSPLASSLWIPWRTLLWYEGADRFLMPRLSRWSEAWMGEGGRKSLLSEKENVHLLGHLLSMYALTRDRRYLAPVLDTLVSSAGSSALGGVAYWARVCSDDSRLDGVVLKECPRCAAWSLGVPDVRMPPPSTALERMVELLEGAPSVFTSLAPTPALLPLDGEALREAMLVSCGRWGLPSSLYPFLACSFELPRGVVAVTRWRSGGGRGIEVTFMGGGAGVMEGAVLRPWFVRLLGGEYAQVSTTSMVGARDFRVCDGMEIELSGTVSTRVVVEGIRGGGGSAVSAGSGAPDPAVSCGESWRGGDGSLHVRVDLYNFGDVKVEEVGVELMLRRGGDVRMLADKSGIFLPACSKGGWKPRSFWFVVSGGIRLSPGGDLLLKLKMSPGLFEREISTDNDTFRITIPHRAIRSVGAPVSGLRRRE